jgi:hypothetical protein
MKNLFRCKLTTNYLEILSLLLGVILTIKGLSGFVWPESIPWQSGAVNKLVIFIFVASTLFFLINRFFIKNLFASACSLIFLLCLISGQIWPLFVVIWFSVSSALIGGYVLTRFNIYDESFDICLLVGAAIYATCVSISSHFPINYSGVYGAALFAPIVFFYKDLKKWSICFFNFFNNKLQYYDVHAKYLIFTISILASIYAAVGLMPEVGHDALASHLFIPSHLMERHFWGFDFKTYIWAVMPSFGDWIFSITYMLGGEIAARLTNLLFIVVLCGLVKKIIIWAGGGDNAVLWGVLIFLSSPLTFAEGNSLFIESIWASYLVAGILIFLKFSFDEHARRMNLVVVGILLGAAIATKVLAFIFIAPLALIIIVSYTKWMDVKNVKPIIFGLIFLIVIGSGAYIYSWYVTGSPLFPFYNKFFKSPYFPFDNFFDGRWNRGLSWDFLYTITFKTQDYAEVMNGGGGFQWLLILMPSVLILFLQRQKRGLAIFGVAFLSIGLCFTSIAYLRYIFPAYVMFTALCGVGVNEILSGNRIQKLIMNSIATITILLNLLFLSSDFGVYQDFPIESIFSKSNTSEYLLTRLPLRNAVNFVNSTNQNRSPVAIFAPPQIAGLGSDAMHINWYNREWREKVLKINSNSDAANLLKNNGINLVIIDPGFIEKDIPIDFVKAVTLPLAKFGPIEVRSFDDRYRFNNELLENPAFSSVNGWNLHGMAFFDKKNNSIVTTVSSPATQVIRIIPGGIYRDEVVARCVDINCSLRTQINWKDGKGQFIKADIKVFSATREWKSYSMDVKAPDNSVQAEYFLTGHSDSPVEFRSASLKD